MGYYFLQRQQTRNLIVAGVLVVLIGVGLYYAVHDGFPYAMNQMTNKLSHWGE